MRVKTKDLKLALDYIQSNSMSEYVEFDTNPLGAAILGLSFTDKGNKVSVISLFSSEQNITPEIKTTSKLYKTP